MRVRFAEWLPGDFEADAFVDPGADCTVLSHRWAQGCRRAAAMEHRLIAPPYPLLDVAGYVTETVSVQVGPSGWLALPSDPQLARQGTAQPEQLREMAGYEDLLLGRDFLRLHRILLVVDGEGEFSLLLPDDDDNAGRRDVVLRALS